MMKKRLLLLSLMMSVSIAGFAETLSGTVKDDGGAIIKAYFTLYEAEGSVIVTTGFSDDKGRYQLSAPSGKYKLRVSAEDYAEVWIKDIALSGSDKVINVTATPQAFVEEKASSQGSDCD